MPNQPYDRTVFNTLEKPVSGDLNQAESQLDYSLRNYSENVFTRRSGTTDQSAIALPNSFIGDGFRVKQNPLPGLSVFLSRGLAYFQNTGDAPTNIGGITNLDDLSPNKPLVMVLDKLISGIPSPVSGRTDIVEIQYLRRLENSQVRDVLNPSTATFNPTSLNKTLAFELDNQTATINGTGAINYKTGVDDGSFTVPTTDVGYTKIAQVRIPAATTSITNSMISDFRYMTFGQHNTNVISARYSQGNNGTLTLTSQNVPPGMLFACTATTPPGTNNRYTYFIVAGNTLNTVNGKIFPTFGMHYNAANSVIVPSILGAGTVTTVDAALQTILAGAATQPALTVGIGQLVFAITVDFLKVAVTAGAITTSNVFTDTFESYISIALGGA